MGGGRLDAQALCTVGGLCGCQALLGLVGIVFPYLGDVPVVAQLLLFQWESAFSVVFLILMLLDKMSHVYLRAICSMKAIAGLGLSWGQLEVIDASIFSCSLTLVDLFPSLHKTALSTPCLGHKSTAQPCCFPGHALILNGSWRSFQKRVEDPSLFGSCFPGFAGVFT